MNVIARHIVVICVLAALTSCLSSETEHQLEPVSADYTVEALLWADSVTLSMTPRRLAAQMVMPAMYATDAILCSALPSLYADSLWLGGVMLLKGDTAAARAITDTLSQMAEVPMIVAMDAEWGLGMRLGDAPDFPLNGAISHCVDDQLMYEYGNEVAREARAIGINMVLGPVLDVASPGSPIGRRSFGMDPVRVAELGIAYARGLEDGNIISVAKHFPGIGRASADTHVTTPHVQASMAELDSVDILPFRQYVGAGLSGVMTGHAAYPTIDTIIRSASLSPIVVTDLLRGELGFRGLVVTDAMNMRGLDGDAHPMVAAILAGADILLAPSNSRMAVEELTEAMADGRLPITVARERVSRILFFKYRLGLAGGVPAVRGSAPLHTPRAALIGRRLRGQ